MTDFDQHRDGQGRLSRPVSTAKLNSVSAAGPAFRTRNITIQQY
jgi:hypothetical protein